MTISAHASPGTAAEHGTVARIRHSITRSEFLAGLFIVGCANGLGGNIIRALAAGDWTGGLENISVIVWFACFAGLSLLFDHTRDKITAADIAIGLVFLALMAAPAAELNWMAVSGLSLYVIVFGWTSATQRRGAWIMLAITVPMLWSRLLFAFLAKFFLEIDATFVGWLLRTDRAGNVIRFADGSGDMVILPACSSLANVSLAFLCWVTLTEWLNHQRSRGDLLWCLLACGSVVFVNVSRISIMGLSQWHYQTFHYGWGATAMNAVILCLILAFTAVGVRRELFSRA